MEGRRPLLHVLLQEAVGAGRGLPPGMPPPDGQEEQQQRVHGPAVVIRHCGNSRSIWKLSAIHGNYLQYIEIIRNTWKLSAIYENYPHYMEIIRNLWKIQIYYS